MQLESFGILTPEDANLRSRLRCKERLDQAVEQRKDTWCCIRKINKYHIQHMDEKHGVEWPQMNIIELNER